MPAPIYRTALGGKIRRGIRVFRPLLPVSVNQLKPLGMHDGALRWSMTGTDPWLLFDFSTDPLKPGHYELSWDAPAGIESMISPRIYVDNGQGVDEDSAIAVSLSCRDGRGFAVFSLPAGALRLRFDPSVRPGDISISGIGLRQRGRLLHHARLASGLAASRIRSPADAARVLRNVVKILRTSGVRSLAQHVRHQAYNPATSGGDYQSWISLYDTISESDRRLMQEKSATWPNRPTISVVMPTYNTEKKFLREAIDSVLDQTYENWELCIADDASTKPHVRRILEQYRRRDARIKVVYRSANGHISRASNSALELATGEWIALLDHDDRLAPHALFCVADAIISNPRARILYSDEDKIDVNGVRKTPYFKCAWNPLLFLGQNLITHLGVYHSSVIREIGGFRTGVEGAQDYDLALRFSERIAADQISHIPHVLYHWRMIPGSTALSADEKPYAMVSGERALNDHFERTEVDAQARLIGFGYRIEFSLPSPPPCVSIIIPTRNGRSLTRNCIESIVTKTSYAPYEIILVDNGSDDPAALAYFRELHEKGVARILRDERPFNYSALNNAAAREAVGSVLCLLNNDIEVISLDWLSHMVSLAMQPGTGAVGAKLYYPDDTIQHAGIIMGLGGLAAHAHWKIPRHSPGYASRAALAQNVSAVTGACLVIRKDHFHTVGGLNEAELSVAYNDVDLCLKLKRAGLKNVWTPFAELYHHESATRGYETTPEKLARFNLEKKYMHDTWPEEIADDPAYSPNLTLEAADFSLAFPPRTLKPWRN